MRISLKQEPFGSYLIHSSDGRSAFFQTDTDLPLLAAIFGWGVCPCRATDGTIDCKHRTAIEMISEAREYLDKHLGDTVDDPGYF